MKVGIFFKVENEFLIYSVPVADGEPYGEAIQYGGHYEYHERFIPTNPLAQRFKVRDYDFYPRGRVVYFTGMNIFHLYTDPCLTPDDISRLIGLFDLAGQIVETSGDEHYRCARCNPHYLS